MVSIDIIISNMIDTHAHLYLCEDSTDELVKRALSAGVTHIVNVGLDVEKSNLAIQEAHEFDCVYATVGTHPCQAKEYDSVGIRQLCSKDKVVAIGEIGLDYYHDDSYKEISRIYFA